MREILFRGKRTDNGEWLYGDLWQKPYSSKNCICIASTIEDFGTRSGRFVIPETVGQYTGLKDKNGTKIFEGDIVKLHDEWSHEDEWKAIIAFGNPNGRYNWGWQLNSIGHPTDYNTDILCWIEMGEVGTYTEIIGNIYDNPELLKGE